MYIVKAKTDWIKIISVKRNVVKDSKNKVSFVISSAKSNGPNVYDISFCVCNSNQLELKDSKLEYYYEILGDALGQKAESWTSSIIPIWTVLKDTSMN